MEKGNIFSFIHTMELLNNRLLIYWNQMFPKNISISQILVLAELWEKGPRKQSDLATRLGFTPGAMTNIANKLIEAGVAERISDEKDRRIVYLAINQSGEDLLLEAMKMGQKMYLQLFQQLTKEEHKALNSVYGKLLSFLEKQK
ncbi:MarR family transcriptional regulator [Bacillus smithii]|uniref:MarR family winged helix-turn-helix transcriptional regulator n=1 Tax=Bacillus smithii TaxID=1479 RepID=UPI0030C90142